MIEKEKYRFNKEKLDKIIDNGAEIIGAVSSTALGFLVAGQAGSFVGSAISPSITNVLKRLGTEVSDQILAPREKARLSATYIKSALLIKERIENGDIPRKDGFFDNKISDRSSAETVLEGILQKTKTEHEEKKLIHYSTFISNITFDESVDYQKCLTYLKIIDRLSYQQLCILYHIDISSQLTFENWSKFFQDDRKSHTYLDFYFEIAELFDLKLLKQFNGKRLGSFHNGEITEYGRKLISLMGLHQISESDINMVKEKIALIESLTYN